MAGMASRCEDKTTGDEGNCGVIYSPYPQSSPLPLRLAYLIQHFGMDRIHAIMKSSDGKTFEQRIDKLREEMSAFERARDVFHMVKIEDGDKAYEDEEEDDEADEDEEDDEADEDEEDEDEEDDEADGKLLDDEMKPDITKRPHAPIEDELECKKPKDSRRLKVPRRKT